MLAIPERRKFFKIKYHDASNLTPTPKKKRDHNIQQCDLDGNLIMSYH